VRNYYNSLLKAMPDLHIEVQRRHASNDAVVAIIFIEYEDAAERKTESDDLSEADRATRRDDVR
jgi:hypothetical protein